MPSVKLDDQEWQQVINILATAPWSAANPLLMKIGQQLQSQQPKTMEDMIRAKIDGKEEAHDEQRH